MEETRLGVGIDGRNSSRQERRGNVVNGTLFIFELVLMVMMAVRAKVECRCLRGIVVDVEGQRVQCNYGVQKIEPRN